MEEKSSGRYYGYTRASTKAQNVDRGILEVERYCESNHIKLEKIYADKYTGKTFERPRYTVLKEDILRPGDTLIITECDRFGRNKKEILREMQYYSDHNIRMMILEIPTTLIDVSAMGTGIASSLIETINNLLVDVFAALAEAEMQKREKRQREGIEAMKLRGEWEKYGRRPIMGYDAFSQEYQNVLNGNMTNAALRRKLGMSKTTYYRYRNRMFKNSV